MAKKYNAKKVRVQVGIAYVNFTTGDKFTSHNGPPDWRDKTVEETNILDAEDAAKQASGNGVNQALSESRVHKGNKDY